MRKFLLVAVAMLSALAGGAQTLQENLWTTNGTVHAVARDGNTLYIGGDFTYVGQTTGNGVPLNILTAAPIATFPQVDGIVNTSVSDGTGGWYIGGNFTSVGGQARNYLAHILSNGSVDAAWNPSPDDQVNVLVVSGSTVYAGGAFTSIGGQVRNRIAALDATTGNATGWNPDADAAVQALVVSGSTVYAGGYFAAIGGQSRSNIAALDAITGAATAWNPSANNLVSTLAVSGSTVYAGGDFTSIGGQSRNYIAALDATTGTATGWNPNASGFVQVITVSGSTVYTGGYFTTIGGQARNFLAALDATTGSASAWNPNPDAIISSLALSGSTLYTGGFFTSIGGQARNYVAAFDTGTGAVTAWNPNANNPVQTIAPSVADVYIGGYFNSVGGQTRNRLAALDATTGQLLEWSPSADATVKALAISGSTVYAGGYFTTIGGQSRNYLAALSATTGSASAWNPNASHAVFALTVSGMTLYTGGLFTTIGGQSRNYIASFDVTTGNLTAWNPNSSSQVNAILAAGNTVYAGGAFSSIGGQSRSYVAALNATTGLATTWNPGALYTNGDIQALAISDTTLYVGGYFTYMAGQIRNRIAALGTVSGAATTWNPDSDGAIHSLLVYGNTIYAGGGFNMIGGQARNYLAALDATTGTATSWNPDLDNTVLALHISGNNLYASGQFARVGGASRMNLAAFTLPPLAVYVATTGNDTSSGLTAAAPKATIQAAANLVADGGTLHIEGGTYDETVTVTDRFATISVSSASPAVIRDLAMNGTGKTLTIGGAVQISRKLALQAGTVAAGGNLTLRSDASQTALIDDFSTGYTGTITGNITAQRYISSAVAGYRYLSAPVMGATVAQLGTMQYPSYYDETRVTASATSIDAGWVAIPNAATVVTPIQGISAYYNSGTQTAALTGTANTGNFSTTVTRTTSGNFTGFNVLGNPYPSPVRWSSIWNLNNNTHIHKTVYVWNNSLNKSALYNFATNTSANGGSDEIAQGQAFRIRVNTIGHSTTFNLNNTVRLATSSNNFLRKEAVKTSEKLRLVLSSDKDKEGYETVIHSVDDATAGIDAAYDGEFMADKGVDVIYSKAENTNLTINALPELKGERTVALGVEVQQAGVYTISATEIEHFAPATAIYLEDRKLGKLVDLAKESSYTVHLNRSEANRFFVHFNSTAKEEAASTSFVNVYAEDGEVTVQFSDVKAAKGTIAIVNMLGETVVEVSNEQQVATLKLNQPVGTYLVKIQSGHGLTVKKVTLK